MHEAAYVRQAVWSIGKFLKPLVHFQGPKTSVFDEYLELLVRILSEVEWILTTALLPKTNNIVIRSTVNCCVILTIISLPKSLEEN